VACTKKQKRRGGAGVLLELQFLFFLFYLLEEKTTIIAIVIDIKAYTFLGSFSRYKSLFFGFKTSSLCLVRD
jgi:hypothetical protein